MNAHVDFITLTLDFDFDGDTFTELTKNRQTCGRQDDESRRFNSLVSHEFSHLLSFLGSPLSDLHRAIVTTQVQLMKEILCEHHIVGSTSCLYVPIFDLEGNLAPNICLAPEDGMVKSKREAWQRLDQLRLFYFGYRPKATIADLVTAHWALRASMATNDKAREVHTSYENPGTWEKHGGYESGFIRSEILDWIKRDLWHETRSDELPILPPWRSQTAKDMRFSVISSMSVLEGLAIVAEVLNAYRNEDKSNAGVRFSVPTPYTIGLKYALECINLAYDLSYTYQDLMSKLVPLEVVVTLAGMFDLAMQIPMLAMSHLGGTLVDLCPGWRLYLVGKLIREKKIGLLENVSIEDTRGDFHDWQAYVMEQLDWPPVELMSVLAAMKFTNQYMGKAEKLEAHDIFDYLKTLARIYRTRNEIAFIQQIIEPRDDEWLNFVGFRTADGQFFSTLKNPSCFEFFRIWNRDYYRLAACMFGTYWDKWWTEFKEEKYSEVKDWIWNVLGAVSGEYARENQSRLLMDRKMEIIGHEIEVRPEYDWGWRR